MGESKSQILSQGSLAKPPFGLKFKTLSLDDLPENIEIKTKILEIIREESLNFPFVIKPDQGERGLGVRVIRSESSLDDYVDWSGKKSKELAKKGIKLRLLIQEYHPGPGELGVFYIKTIQKGPMGRDSFQKGKIFSITEKKFFTIKGDGISRFGQIVLNHPRLSLQSKLYKKKYFDLWDSVLPAEEEFSLAEIGNHAQGSMFLDGRRFLSPNLEREVTTLAESLPGFYFGRFDIRFSDPKNPNDPLKWKVVELNGVLSESTNIYDPAMGIFQRYKTLFRQWDFAFQIGRARRNLGDPLPTWGTIFSLLTQNRVYTKIMEQKV